MKGDFTRVTFRPENHYSGVRLQQGRVQLDADWNEQVEIQAHLDRTTRSDMIGLCGAPEHDAGFQIAVRDGTALVASKGRYYVDGILCENDEDDVLLVDQEDLPGFTLPTTPGLYLAYLDSWQRHITACEAPAIREVALGGPDTATRTKTVWQVRLLRVGDADAAAHCSQFGPTWSPAEVSSSGELRARAVSEEPSDEPCIVPPGAGYRGLENQLYRVEIHDDSEVAGGPTFKWSRDNGSLVTRLERIDGDTLTVSDPGKDAVSRVAPGEWVELSDEGQVLRGEPGILLRLAAVEGHELTVEGWGGDGSPPTLGETTILVRRWDSPGALPLTTGDYLDIEDGVQVEFHDGDYRTGDYWLIPARTVLGDVLWPVEASGEPRFERRRGIDHHYCPLALVQLAGSTWTVRSDCRRLFPPVTELTGFFYLSGDGQEAMPGEALPRPLQVGVANGRWPVAGARVGFQIMVDGGNGTLEAGGLAGQRLIVATDPDGVAECRWRLDATTQNQRVEATLLIDTDSAVPLPMAPPSNGPGETVQLPIHFNANLSVASEVAYDSSECRHLAEAPTVQDAIDRLCGNIALRYLSGDGQEAWPGQPLEQPLQVVVANGQWPVEGAKVEFSIVIDDGGGGLRLDGRVRYVREVTAATGPDGVAQCFWRLDGRHSQQVEAVLLDDAGDRVQPPIRFTANPNVASQVFYDSSNCRALAEAKVETVQQAIDQLCQTGGTEPGIHITGVFANASGDEKPLGNDTRVPASWLAGGLRIECDAAIERNRALGNPAVLVTLYLPFPWNAADKQLWGNEVVAYQPLVLAPTTDTRENNILWKPSAQTIRWLQERLFQAIPVVPATLEVRGNFIWAEGAPEQYLDGDTFGLRGADGVVDLVLPSGDGRRGGDFRMWFWLRR